VWSCSHELQVNPDGERVIVLSVTGVGGQPPSSTTSGTAMSQRVTGWEPLASLVATR